MRRAGLLLGRAGNDSCPALGVPRLESGQSLSFVMGALCQDAEQTALQQKPGLPLLLSAAAAFGVC